MGGNKSMKEECVSEAFLSNFDVELQDFYHGVVREEMELDAMWKAKALVRALNEVVEAYTKQKTRQGESAISFDTKHKRCAYVLKHSTCFTSAVAKYMTRLINETDENQIIFYKILNSGRLNICCLGGGPATDAVAIIKVVGKLYGAIWRRTGKKLDIQITVIDLNGDWHETARKVLDCLKNSPFFDKDMLELNYDFLTADLTLAMSDEVKKTLNSADLLTLIYFLSAVNGSPARDKSLKMVQNIMLEMKKGAVLFYLDSAAEHHCKLLNEAAVKRPSMLEIYGPLVEEYHAISLESVRKFLELNAKYFDTFFCMTNIFLSVHSWYKMKTKQPRAALKKELKEISKYPWPKPTQEDSDALTKEMEEYRISVRREVKETYAKLRKCNDKIRKQNFR